MKKQLLRFTLYAIIIYLTCGALNPAIAATHPLARNGTHFCGVNHYQPRWHRDYKGLSNRNYARTFASDLNVGQPRTVRLIYFLPNDRPYQAEVVQRMKDTIRTVQTFFADHMEVHGYGRRTFRVETDRQGELIVHRVDGRHPDRQYLESTEETVRAEIYPPFDIGENVYLVVIDNSIEGIGRGEDILGGVGGRSGKQGGDALVSGTFGWDIVAHELGHAFGLLHDFSDGAYIMSYGPGERTELSKCHAESLSVHPYFSPDIPIAERNPPTIELISPHIYPSESRNVSVRLKVSDSDGLHQLILHADQPNNRASVKFCRGLTGENEKTITFDYDGVIPSAHDPVYSSNTSLLNPLIHPIRVEAIDTDGNVDNVDFVLFSDALQPLSKISGDNLQGLPNTPLPVPFVVELWDLNDGSVRREVPVTFSVTGGGGRLSVERVKTDDAGRAESTLTLGPNLGTNTVEVSAEGLTVTFNAVAGAPVDIRDATLRTVIEEALDMAPGTPIAPAEIAILTELNKEPPSSSFQPPIYPNINNLTGLEHATNLESLNLRGEINSSNSVLDLSPLAGLTNLKRLGLQGNTISDLSPLASLINLEDLTLGNSTISDRTALSDLSPLSGLTNLTSLFLSHNTISDLSPLANLTNLAHLSLWNSPISDLSPLSGLTNLTSLFLPDNAISDLSPLSGLTNLTSLFLPDNAISDLSPLSGLTNLTSLFLSDNAISDLTALSGLTNLTGLYLEENSVSDLSPLVANTGLGRGSTVNVKRNPLNVASINTHIPALQSIGVTVEFDNVITELVTIPDTNLRAAIEKNLGKASGAPITTVDMERLIRLEAKNANISDLTGLEFATNLTELYLSGERIEGRSINSNNISNLSPLSGLTKLTDLWLELNAITDISPVAGLANLTQLELGGNNISGISTIAGLTNLTRLGLWGNSISDISAVSGLTKLVGLWVWDNDITDLSAVSGLTDLTYLAVGDNNISDISVVSRLTNLIDLRLPGNNISDISPLVANAGLGSGGKINIRGNPLSYASIYTHIPTLQSRGVTVEFDTRKVERLLEISGDNQQGTVGAVLTDPFVVEVRDGNGAVFAEVPVSFALTVGSGTLSVTSTTTDENGRAESTFTLGNNVGMNTISVSATEIQQTVTFNAVAEGMEFDLSVPMGTSLIHIPLKVTAVDGMPKTITSIADLYDALNDARGGADIVNFLITYDSSTQEWYSYFVPSDKDTPADRALTDDTGIIAGLKARVSLRLSGTALGTDGNSTITLNQGLNLVGIPLRDERINRVSDLLRLDGIGGNVPVIILNDDGKFKVVGRAGDPGDIEITGGQAFIMTASQEAVVNISGDAWANDSGTAAAPSLSLKGIEVGNTTPVLGLKGSVVDEKASLDKSNFRVTVKNLSTGKAVTGMTKDERSGYRLTVVDIETARAATIGDILEISAQSPHPFIGVEPLTYTVTTEDVKRSLIQLPELVTYEIPAETVLLHNYPNPFNPETWIPYRLAEDAFVTLTIYDGSGQVVRTLDVGYRIASAYENRSKAIYWDGRNDVGEWVASGVYFYHLSAGDYLATQKMVILK